MIADPARVTLFTGGARSGKSDAALALANRFAGGRRCFIAAAQACDDEMAQRIVRHRADRGPGWITVEEPMDWSAAVAATGFGDCVVVDCLTIWTANHLLAGRTELDFEPVLAGALAAIATTPARVIAVTNEVGMGIVPDNKISRDYRDWLGRTNIRFAAAADRVVLMTCGIPWVVKGPSLP